MKKEIIAVIWNDASAFEEELLDDENFSLSPTLQIGLLHDEDDEKIRLVHGFSLDYDEHDFVVIPKPLIIKRKNLGFFNTQTNEIYYE